MRFISTLVVVLAAILALASAVEAGTPHVLKESIETVPRGWSGIGRNNFEERQMDLVFMLKHSEKRRQKLNQHLMEVSDPSHARYGKHLTHDEVTKLTAPSRRGVAAVMAFLAEHNAEVVQTTPSRDMIMARVPVTQAERMLKAEYQEYAHDVEDVSIVRTTSYSLPESVHQFVDSVGPTVRFPNTPKVRPARAVKTPKNIKSHIKRGKKNLNGGVPSACSSQGNSPACLLGLYGVNTYTAAGSGNLTVTGYLEQYISTSDLSSFFSQYDPSATRNATIIGPNDETNPGVEASLDIQYSMAMAPNLPTTFWYTAGRQPNNTENEPFLVFLMNLASDVSPPLVISTSYGDNENTVNYQYAVNVNTQFQAAGARGISLLYSSGDGGVAGSQSTSCVDFIPTFPAGSPYVTAVGATTSYAPETAASFSAGGFSNYWPNTDSTYQASAVNAYLTNYGASTLPTAGLYNATGRGFPDVSFQGTNFPVVVGGFAQPVDGTSCSSPSFAGIVALLNDIRLSAGKAPLGFLNPLFYQNPTMFNDITSGNNPGCNTNGFTAVTGWDPITGLGSPNFPQMASVIKGLP